MSQTGTSSISILKVAGRFCLPAALAPIFCLFAGHACAQSPAEFRWAGDAEGGAPFVEADPAHPDSITGFDVEIAGLLARGLRRVPRFVMITFTSIDQSIARGDAEIGLSGIEDTPRAARRSLPRFPTTNFAKASACGRWTRRGSGLSRICGPQRGDTQRHDRARHPPARRARPRHQGAPHEDDVHP
jgi:polar amino acid transport system substrate-binding protein